MSEIVKAGSAFEPTSYAEARALAKDYAMSGICRFKSPEQVMLVLATAKDLGVPYTTALRSMYITDGGTVGMEADLMVALCLQAPVCEYFYCSFTDGTKATYVTKRRDRAEQTLSFTIEEAKTAGLVRPTSTGKDNVWMKWGPDMLRHRAAAKLARMVYPDILGGVYSQEELGDFRSAAAAVKPIVAAPVVTAAGNVQTEHAPAEAWVPAEVVDTPEVPTEDWPALIAALTSVKEVKALADRMPKDKELTAALTARYNELKKGAA